MLEDVLESRDRDTSTVDVSGQGQIRFLVWVSFHEIYNEQIFDLLVPLAKKYDSKRPAMRICEDGVGRPYVKGKCCLRVACGFLLYDDQCLFVA